MVVRFPLHDVFVVITASVNNPGAGSTLFVVQVWVQDFTRDSSDWARKLLR